MSSQKLSGDDDHNDEVLNSVTGNSDTKVSNSTSSHGDEDSSEDVEKFLGAGSEQNHSTGIPEKSANPENTALAAHSKEAVYPQKYAVKSDSASKPIIGTAATGSPFTANLNEAASTFTTSSPRAAPIMPLTSSNSEVGGAKEISSRTHTENENISSKNDKPHGKPLAESKPKKAQPQQHLKSQSVQAPSAQSTSDSQLVSPLLQSYLPNLHNVRNQKSNRSIKSATRSVTAQPNRVLLKQKPQGSYHRQYVLLRDKQGPMPSPLFSPANPPLSFGTNSDAAGFGLDSPQLYPVRSARSLRSKTHPKRESSKYVFSVDDDEDEVEEDLNREYLQDYNNTLHHRRSQLPSQANGLEGQPLSAQADYDDNLASLSNFDDNSTIRQTTSRLSENEELQDADHSTSVENPVDEDAAMTATQSRKSSVAPIDPAYDEYPDDASTGSNESFTLRERQDAINETHPFGIRIWKPAVYKKHRSVEKEADNDIHSNPSTAKTIGKSVKFFNFLWTCTFGLAFFSLCLIFSALTAIMSIICVKCTDQSLKYAQLYLRLGLYLLMPFGKIVLMNSSTNYIREDAYVGTSVADFRRWRAQNEGRLFFSAPNAMKGRITEATPLNSRLPPNARNYTDHSNVSSPQGSSDHAHDGGEDVTVKERLFGRGQWNAGRVAFFLQFYLIFVPFTSIIAFAQWLGVFTIPMAKALVILLNHLRMHPLALSFEPEKDYYEKRLNSIPRNESILICTYRSFGFHYYKYTVDGTNIFFINLNFLVIFTIFDYFCLNQKLHWVTPITNPSFIFILCLASIIPLAYFIGQAVASISAQTSMGVGAVINAFFSTIVEVFLYCVALNQSKAKLVEGSIIGSILGAVLLLPGTSMCSGAIRRKTQRYNPASAGVSSTMLLYSILIMFSPTILHQIFGQYEERCRDCTEVSNSAQSCKRCHYIQSTVVIDRLYTKYLRPFTIVCSICLFTAYCIGLLFTLKTHAALIWSTPVSVEKEKRATGAAITVQTPENSSMGSRSKASGSVSNQNDLSLVRALTRSTSFMQSQQQQQRQPQQPQLQQQTSVQSMQPQMQQQQQLQLQSDGGHDSPNWSRSKSTSILLLATFTYAIIAEILVDVVDDVLKAFPINPKFLGLTVFALVPNTTEFVNAILFAMHGNVALSMEIGSAYALQVCLLQIPILVVYTCWGAIKTGFIDPSKLFSLIFPRWDFIACLMSVYMFTYVYAEGKSNYFKGSILILLYIGIISGFFIAISIDDEHEYISKGAALTSNLLFNN